MKTYKRISDGFQVQDSKDRSIEWAVENYGGEFVEVLPPAEPTPEELAKAQEIAECRAFLANTDYKILRQQEQSTMSAEEYSALLVNRQAKRDRINELEAL